MWSLIPTSERKSSEILCFNLKLFLTYKVISSSEGQHRDTKRQVTHSCANFRAAFIIGGIDFKKLHGGITLAVDLQVALLRISVSSTS